jgi:ABC-type multidrug transport system ATPase subunit
MPSPRPILQAADLGRDFGDRVVVRGLTLALEPGERIALRGPNGSGKTTILRCLAGTLTLSRGLADIDGHPTGSLPARALTGVSLSQERAFYMRLSGRANMTFFARVRGFSRRDANGAVTALEEELEIGHILDERVDRCSTGMIQQLSFARALLEEPPLLLLDEPTRSLDDHAVKRLWGALERRTDAAVLIATHSEDDVGHCHQSIELPT